MFRSLASKALLAAQRMFHKLRRRFRPRTKVALVVERPTTPRKNRLYVTIQAGEPAFGVMICPCGCGETLNLRFLQNRRPRWDLLSKKGNATVRPSIWRTTGCRSHFFLINGRVAWCPPHAPNTNSVPT